MERNYYTHLGESGLRMPIAADLVLHEKENPDAIRDNGEALGKVVEETARRYKTPLAVPRMDLELEKKALLEMLEIPSDEIATYHFNGCPDDSVINNFNKRIDDPLTGRLKAHIEAIGYIAKHTDLLPVGMSIGPFSLTTKLVADPITPIGLAGYGVTAEEDEEIRAIENLLEMSARMIMRSISAQIEAGAKAVFIAEPAANKVYFSPNQIEAGSDIFERFVMDQNRKIKAMLNEAGVDLFFHCCGELIDYMLLKFTELDPAILSLGSSRKLWEDAKIVPNDIVLYGNLPSKQFYSDSVITEEQVEQKTRELLEKMQATGHPFLLGTECDVLSVPGCEAIIRKKVAAMMR